MKILIVCDESIVSEYFKTSDVKKRFGIKKVISESAIHQAKNVFVTENIDILIFDTVSMHGSKLHFLNWVRWTSPQTRPILLIDREDRAFKIANTNIGQTILVYKPVTRDELLAAIEQAINTNVTNNNIIDPNSYRKFWIKNQPIILERLWLDIINKKLPPKKASILSAVFDRGIFLPDLMDMKYIPILFRIKRWEAEPDATNKKLMEFAFKNIIEETLMNDGINGQLVDLNNSMFSVIMPIWNNSDLSLLKLKEDCRSCVDYCATYLKCDLSCYIGSESFIYDLASAHDKLIDLDNNNVAYSKNVFLYDNSRIPKNMDLPDMCTWSVMLLDGFGDKLFKEAINYLAYFSKIDGFSLLWLKHFLYDFMQMLFLSLKQQNIIAHQFMYENETIKLFDDATKSVVDMTIWLDYSIKKYNELTRDATKSRSVANHVSNYIALNIEKPLMREDIAKNFHFSADHLDRIFRKEKGCTLSKYIIKERINQAKKLLSGTRMPISFIASTLGYCRISHFSTQFKNEVNMNPSDYRKN